MWVQFLGWEDSLKEGMATHSSILAWRIPWTEKPGGLQSQGCKELDMTEVSQQARELPKGLGSIPDWGTKIPHPIWCSKKQKKDGLDS